MLFNFSIVIYSVLILSKILCLELELIEICTDLTDSSRSIKNYIKQECQKKTKEIIDISSPHITLTIRIHDLTVFGGLNYVKNITSYKNIIFKDKIINGKFAPMVNPHDPHPQRRDYRSPWRDVIFYFELLKDDKGKYLKQSSVNINFEFHDPYNQQTRLFNLNFWINYTFHDIVPTNIFDSVDDREKLIEYVLKENTDIYSLDEEFVSSIINFVFKDDSPIKKAKLTKAWKIFFNYKKKNEL